MIDPKLQAELRSKYNPDGSDLRNMQLRMLDMLKYIDKICSENDIKYWLSSGTCLGAVRHGGFIPWDDDVDIELEKKDYNKLCRILKQRSEFFLQDHSTDSEYLAPYAKLRDLHSYLKENNTNDLHYKYHGIYIDIFCLEPSSSVNIYRISSVLQRNIIYPLAKVRNDVFRHLLINALLPIFHKGVFSLISFLSKIGSKGWYRHIPGSCFKSRRSITDFLTVRYVAFEDVELPVPIHTKEYLQRIYGNYEELPPLESISTHINNIEFYKKN